MINSTIYSNKSPYKNLFHTDCWWKGNKMSKSLGNGINEFANTKGADILRFMSSIYRFYRWSKNRPEILNKLGKLIEN